MDAHKHRSVFEDQWLLRQFYRRPGASRRRCREKVRQETSSVRRGGFRLHRLRHLLLPRADRIRVFRLATKSSQVNLFLDQFR